jgi:hypothetical protein
LAVNREVFVRSRLTLTYRHPFEHSGTDPKKKAPFSTIGPGETGKLTLFGIQQPPPIIILDSAFLSVLFYKKLFILTPVIRYRPSSMMSFVKST